MILRGLEEEKLAGIESFMNTGGCRRAFILRYFGETTDLASLRIIMASGIDKTEECLAAGADVFLLKPYLPEDLFSKLRTLSPKTDE